jgi:hypothetical protein
MSSLELRPGPRLSEQALRINGRFNLEVIEAFDVCPYASGARRAERSRRLVAWSREPDVSDFLDVVSSLEADDSVEVAQVVMPLMQADASVFQDFAAEMGRKNAERFPGRRPVFVHAAFHPDLPYATDTPQRLVPLFRRSPDATIQLIRLSVLDDLHAQRPRGTQFWGGSSESLSELLRAPKKESITDLITRENHERALSGMLERILAILDDLAGDRARTYADLAREGA